MHADKLTLALLMLLALAAVLDVAFGMPPPGTDLSGAEHAWWECNKQPNGVSCCSEADGHSLSDNQWRIDPPSYDVRVEGDWFVVPGSTIISTQVCGPDPDIGKQSEAKVWYVATRDRNGRITDLHIFCFEPGLLY